MTPAQAAWCRVTHPDCAGADERPAPNIASDSARARAHLVAVSSVMMQLRCDGCRVLPQVRLSRAF
jgi:hypothetical protein